MPCPHLTTPSRASEPRGHELRRHQLTLFDRELVQHPSGLWLTSPLRTALDCVVLLGHEAGVCALDAALHREMFSPMDLDAAIAARVGHPGVRALALAAAAADSRAESPNETLARLILLPVLPGLEPQVTLRNRSGRVLARFDLADKRLRLAIEMDGKRGHAGEAMVAKDQRRDRRSAGEGWWTERGTWFDVRRQQDAFRERVVARARVLGERAA